MRNPYTILGLNRGASAQEIKAAYRRLAREMHPDTDQANARAEDEFKEISAAYSLLSDPKKRAAFDRGEIDGNGQKIRRGPAPGSGPGAKRGPFQDFFRNRAKGGPRPGSGGPSGRSGPSMKIKGANVTYTLTVSFQEAATGTTKRINVATGKTLDVRLPPGTRDGQVLRLRGQGMGGMGGGEDGDALVEITVRPDPAFLVTGDDVETEIDISLPEAILGGRINARTIDGEVAVTVPPNSNSGTRLRLRGKGLKKDGRPDERGDQYVKLRVVLPKEPDKDLNAFIGKWAKKKSYDVR
ncbi:MAG: DnaJ C-terminal domain-containing protein [Magnetovibrionaceae bacterium]